MSNIIRRAPTLVVAAVFGFSIAIAINAVALRSGADQASPVPLESLRNYTDVLERVKRDYVDELTDEELIENSIRGMLNELDPHSAYLDADEFKSLRESTSGEFGGLGIQVGMRDNVLTVIAPIDDTPADRAGVQAGDKILRIDGELTRGIDLETAVKKLRGAPNTDVTITVVRDGEPRPIDIEITRAIIKTESVRYEMLEPGLGYVRVSQFQERTAAQLSDALDQLIEVNGDKKLRGLIIDLRNNPGGVLKSAVDMVDLFQDGGKIVYTEGRVRDSQMNYRANRGDRLEGKPIVILVNGGSASGSEIVAGALQDHNRALIVGEPTFGKGSVQSIMPLSSGGALRLTTARYYTPEGRSIQAEGIKPDIVVHQLKVSNIEEAFSIRESDLGGHLSSEQAAQELFDQVLEEGEETDKDEQPLAVRDFQLYQALNLLKGMIIATHAR